jgi:hypothetical protein
MLKVTMMATTMGRTINILLTTDTKEIDGTTIHTTMTLTDGTILTGDLIHSRHTVLGMAILGEIDGLTTAMAGHLAGTTTMAGMLDTIGVHHTTETDMAVGEDIPTGMAIMAITHGMEALIIRPTIIVLTEDFSEEIGTTIPVDPLELLVAQLVFTSHAKE